MGDAGGAEADAGGGTHLGMVANRGLVKKNSWKKVVFLVASCLWFCVTTSLAFLIRFMSRRFPFLRIKRKEDSSRHGDSDSASMRLMEKLVEASKSEEEDSDASKEKEASVFQFRFSFQAPEEGLSSREVQGSSDGEETPTSMTTSISNYNRFLSERDLKGFLEAPQAMTMCVQESFMGSDGFVLENTEELDGELKSRFSSLKHQQQADSDAGDAAYEGEELSKSLHADEVVMDDTEELDMELNLRFSSVKCLDSDGVAPEGAEALDRELKTRLSSMKSPRQGWSAAAEEAHGDEEACTSLHPDGVALGNTEKLDRELTTRFLTVKSSGSDVGAAVRDSTGGMSPGSLHKAEESEESEPVIQFIDQENKLHSVSLLTSKVRSHARACFLSKRKFDSDSESESSSDGYSVKDLNLDFDSDEFLSERDFEPVTDKGSLFEMDRENERSLENAYESEETQLPNPHDNGSFVDSGGENLEFVEAMKNCTDANLMAMQSSISPSVLHLDVSSDRETELDVKQEPGIPNSNSSDNNGDEDGIVAKAASPETIHSHNSQAPEGPVNSDVLGENADEQERGWEDSHKASHSQEDSQNSEETHLSKSEELSKDESEELESLWEHQDLIDQLRMELKKVRSIGLPTILEESDSPKSIEGLKPLKFDAKFLHEDPMDELHKFYKSYRERMRKFDILNYQKMYAVGFLQLKDPLESMGTQKPLIPTITSLLSHNIWPRRRRSVTDLSEKFVKELQSDLETVYVGQSCLSWEFLRWQYERCRELLESDLQDGHQYNQVHGEFQQFQVLIQRFLEDEPFQGPRVANYVKNRCVIRSLLQVPVIREDYLKDKMEERSKGEDAVTCEQLECIIEDAIRVLWEFFKADKDDTPMIMKGLIGNHVELQDPTDRELMADIQANLQKKEKKLKDIVRTGNCLVRKFKKPREGRSSQDDLFFSQVDLKLVSRVLKMTRITTEQLLWCHKKLSKINFVDRKLARDPSFFLFPC